MTATFDASGIGQLVIRLGLATEEQVQECLEELGNKKAPGEDMIRLLERKRYLSPFQSHKLRKGDTEGYFLGGYRILYKIASGSFGRVYRGDDPRTGQVVAIKVLRNKWTMDKQKIDLFLREGKLGMSIRHPNIVSVLAVGQDAPTGQYYIVMEFIEGGNLRDILQIRKKLEVDEALRIIEECAQGLEYAWQRGLTHRDIKPTNILIEAKTGQTKLVDFGLAQISSHAPTLHLQRQEDLDEDIAVDRTVDYAGLEKATHQQPGDVRSDIFFLGCVLYECLTGQPLMPVTRDRQARMQARRYQEVEETLRRQGPAQGLTPPLMRLLQRMVAFDPAQRLQNPTELLDAIQQCRQELRGGTVATSAAPSQEPKTLVVIEARESLKEPFRKLNQKGYRVVLSSDPQLAVRQFRKQPFDALVMDGGTVGREAVEAFNEVARLAQQKEHPLAAVLLLTPQQAEWEADVMRNGRTDVLYLPVNFKQLLRRLQEMSEAPLTAEEDNEDVPSAAGDASMSPS
ncbi:serine/threonine-protein kinase [Thermogemmata fonticola]|uniref:Protein kinase n=1 Tax=Thermogemmata fonticola TaxID=2755323 RepID=A0A7V8VC30_9BACT|nr:serine/threonine-protein kinase [Thermogemmata fonticola]MBA2225274.1 protein kinase [Thermogemmata fonticola]